MRKLNQFLIMAGLASNSEKTMLKSSALGDIKLEVFALIPDTRRVHAMRGTLHTSVKRPIPIAHGSSDKGSVSGNHHPLA